MFLFYLVEKVEGEMVVMFWGGEVIRNSVPYAQGSGVVL